MTITLNKEELYQFQLRLDAWYAQRFGFIVQNFVWDYNGASPEEQLERLSKEFVEKNPQPDWRTLL